MVIRYWSMRTDKKQPAFFYSELKAGRLRQGWGYSDDVDLRNLQRLKGSGRELTKEQQDAWRGNWRLLPNEPDAIKRDDIVLLPNLPEPGLWSVARIVDDDYRFEVSSEFGDYGHIRNVQLLNADAPINPYSTAVHADLRKTMRAQVRLWNVDQYSESIQVLLDAISHRREVGKPESGAERLSAIRRTLKAQLWEHVDRGFQGSEFEEVCRILLEQAYETVEHTAGSGERGADFVCDSTDGLGVPYRVVVQVKKWAGESDLRHPLEQIREAVSNYEEVTAAVIIVTLDSLNEAAEEAVRGMSYELRVPISVLTKDDILDLLMLSLGEDPDAVRSE